MNHDEITQQTDESQRTSRPGDEIDTGDYSIDDPVSDSADESLTQVEEYSVLEFLGKGGFGAVYRAYDSVLQREVALKVPHRRLVNQAELAAAYLREARAMARLDHPHIVPVYRAAETPEVACYLVTKLIRGCHFGQWIRRHRPSYRQLAKVFRCVAEALAYAHSRGIVHRDIKPGNILLDEESCPYVVDFGLALRDVEQEGRSAYIGTPAYMSPEQARGEGHRVDGRSDIFSLGVVMYQALTDSKPFRGDSRDSLFQEIIYHDPVPPREIDPSVPPELSRICLKALAKSVHDRYANCDSLVDDLAYFIDSSDAEESALGSNDASNAEVDQGDRLRSRRVVPKGLRPFDLRDADHFLQLLPGPYDRDGLPDVVRFWLSRIRSDDPLNATPVGLIYGPSGCGKTSLVRAGIIPRLKNHCTTIYVQATSEGTEANLLSAIRSKFGENRFSDSQSVGLVDHVSQLRRGEHQKVVIFIDQFEQWLFSHPELEREPLTAAIRQCDGVQVQCVLMVRDDFWLGISRLMQAVDLPIAENDNATLIDLFDTRHARKVLALFGTAHGRLPDSQQPLSISQSLFIDSAIRYLASDGRVICVQLALLTEMLKNRDWDASSDLFKDGGTGIGVRFLDETFDNERSARRVRLFAEGAERVLRALLPESGSSIKGSVRSEQQLMDACGYRDKAAFRRLVAVLDGELHLITPTDRTEDDSFSGESSISEIGTTGYQLTHDFLIAPIRQWVELRNRTTRAGKARLRLEEFTELYRSRPLTQALPTLQEYLSVRRYIPIASLNDDQQRMMRAARKYHLGRVATWAALFVLVLGIAGSGYRFVKERIRLRDNEAALSQLLGAELSQAIVIADRFGDDPWIRSRAKELIADDDLEASTRVRAALVCSDDHQTSVDTLIDYALQAPVDEVVQLARGVVPVMEPSIERAVEVWRAQASSRSELVRAACLIANHPGRIELLREPEQQTNLTQLLLAENPVWSKNWGLGFSPLSDELVPRLASHLAEPTRSQNSLTAVSLLRQFAEDDFELLASLVRTTKAPEFNLLLETLESDREQALAALQTQWEAVEYEEAENSFDVKRPWGSPWWAVGDRMPVELSDQVSLDEELQQRLLEFESAIGPHAIVAHKIPQELLEETSDRLAVHGYRVAQYSSTRFDGDQTCLTVWLRDGLQSYFVVDRSAEELARLQEDYRGQGRLLDTISVRFDEAGQTRYFACWIDPQDNNGVTDADLYLEVDADEHESRGWRPFMEKGLSLPRCNRFLDGEGSDDKFSSVRWKTARGLTYSDAWGQSPDEFESIVSFNRGIQVLIGSTSRPLDAEVETSISPVWWRDTPVETRLLDYQGRLDHFRAAQELIGQGFYPVSSDATVFAGDATYLYHSVWWRGLPDIETAIIQSRVKCNLALAQFRLRDTRHVESALAGELGEEMRGAVLAAFADLQMDPEWLIDQVQNAEDPMLRRSCLMALKLIPLDQVSPQQRTSIADALRPLLAKTSDPGIRSATRALSQAWQLELTLPKPSDPDREYVTTTGQRMVIVRPEEISWLGSYGNEPGRDGAKEPRTAFKIPYDYAIATHEVTAGQYREFRKDFEYAINYAPSADCPAIGLTWYDAAKYCRWLSEIEGIPESQMCYPKINDIKPGMVLPTGSNDRNGYRLPTESEWEHACRGGVDRNRWFGFDPLRLDDHAWTVSNSDFVTKPVRQLLPNHYGLFDMLGNAMEWCQSPQFDYPKGQRQPANDPGNGRIAFEGRQSMAVRGGAMLYQPSDARASQRNVHGADTSWVYIGFRIARTIPSGK